jgi:predicted GTPase
MNLNDNINQELKAIEDRLKPPSVALIGRTGTGKSSLIKNIFGLNDDEIDANAGFPQTKYYKRYPDPYDPEVPIILYDSPGYEADKTSEFLEDTLQFIQKNSLDNAQSVDEQIHLVWYLIHAGLGRIENFDLNIIETALRSRIPVLIILSQCDTAKPKEIAALKEKLRPSLSEISKRLNLSSNMEPKIMEVAADPKEPDPPFGVSELTEESIKAIPKSYSEAFIRAQSVNLKAKRREASFIVATAAATCLGSAFIPIPGSTPASILTTQTTLLPSIARVYNLGRYFDKKVALGSMTFSGLIAIGGATIVDVASSFFSTLFPPLFIAGEFISGTTAATYIVTIGLAYTSTLEAISKDYLYTSTNQKEIEQFFGNRFSSEFKKYKDKVDREGDIKKIIELLKQR